MFHLNSLRGIAALLVVLYHVKHLLTGLIPQQLYDALTHTYLAVDFFFVLSGYILSWKYLEDTKSQSFANFSILFIKKRLVRIYPLHLLILIAYSIIPFAMFVTDRLIADRYSIEMFVPHVFLIQSWGLFNSIGWNIPSWSISTEFLAYLTFPVACLIIKRTSQDFAILLFIIIVAMMAALFNYYDADNIGQYISSLGWLRCLAGFYIGFFIHLILNKKDKFQWLLIVQITLVVTCFIVINLRNYFYIDLLFALTLFFIVKYGSFFQVILVNRPLLYLGEISYSLYMVHYLVRDILTMLFLKNDELATWSWLALYISLTILISAFTYKFIEVELKNKLTAKLI